MIETARVAQARSILELGPGTGAFTSVIHETMPVDARYLGLDLNPVFIRTLRRRFPGLNFEAAPAQEFDYAGFFGCETGLDCIISGLPWTAFPESLQISILDSVMPLLHPGGVFVTFAYTGLHNLPNGRRFRKLLQTRCGRLEWTPTVWRNLPPAFVYAAIR